MRVLVILISLAALAVGCSKDRYLVARPGDYGYVTHPVRARVLWPAADGKFTEAVGELPAGTVILVPRTEQPQ